MRYIDDIIYRCRTKMKILRDLGFVIRDRCDGIGKTGRSPRICGGQGKKLLRGIYAK